MGEQESANATREAPQGDRGFEKAIWVLWFFRLFKPEWILSFYVPALTPLRAVSAVLLYSVFLLWLLSGRRRYLVGRSFTFYCLVILASTLAAENFGRSSDVLRGMADSLVFYQMSVALITGVKGISNLMRLYLAAFVFYGVVGLANHGLVPFHVLLNNEDAFGPFMAMGLPLLLFAAFRLERVSWLNLAASLLCVVGVVASLARGAFVSLCFAAMYSWARHPRKLTALLVGTLVAGIGLTVASPWLKNTGYLEEIASISQSVRGDSIKGEDRHFLVRKAVEIFTMFPVLGAGPMNYGYVLPKIMSWEEAEWKERTPEQMYGRTPHNIYAQVLSELGACGMIAFLALITGFAARNRAARRAPASPAAERITRAYSAGFLGSMLVFLINGLFYNLLYAHWFEDLLIMNSILYLSRAQPTAGPAEDRTMLSAP